MRSAAIAVAIAALLVPAIAGADAPGSRHVAWSRSVSAARALFGATGAGGLMREARIHHRPAGARPLTHVLAALATHLRELASADRKEVVRLLARPSDAAADPQQNGWTAPEAPGSPYCGAHYCVHWVASGADAPSLADANGNSIPDYVETVLGVAEHVHAVENDQLGWREPKSDGTLGGGAPNHTDIYLKDLGGTGIYGYTSPDPGQVTGAKPTNSLYSYLVVDSSFGPDKFPRYTSPLIPLEVTLAHEYNHVLHFTYDALEDTWMFEATAVWMEGRVYPDPHDYLQYLPGWVSLTQVPLTTFNGSNPNDRSNVKVYGSSVWSKFLDGRYGPNVIRGAWEQSVAARSFAPDAYDRSIKRMGGSGFFDEFSRFSAQTAEWQAPNAGWPDGPLYPDVQRVGTLQPDGPAGALTLDHTTFGEIDVPRTADRVKLVVSAPPGTQSALALVGRSPSAGEVTQLTELPRGGAGAATLTGVSTLSRLTAVVVNADVSHSDYSQALADWPFQRNGQRYTVRVTTDFTPPRARARAPRPGQRRVRPRTSVQIAFTKPVLGVSTRTVVLVGPHGRGVRVRVRYSSGSHVATLTPLGTLRAGRYTVRVRGVTDNDLNEAPSTRWTFSVGR